MGARFFSVGVINTEEGDVNKGMLYWNWNYQVNSFFFFLFRPIPAAYGSSQARGQIGAASAGLHHSHSNARSEPGLQPIPQLMATLDS